MKSEFDKNLKQKLEQASPEDAGLSLDRNKLWGKIEQKQKGKSVRFMPWISHAAAVAAGLLIGLFFFLDKNNEHEQVEVAQHNELKPTIVKVTDTIYIAQQQPGIKAEHDAKPATVKTLQKKVQHTPPQQVMVKENPSPVPNREKPEEPGQAPVMAAVSPKPVKVLHLNDINNENASPHIRERRTPFFNIARINMNETGSETMSMLVARKLNLTKN